MGLAVFVLVLLAGVCYGAPNPERIVGGTQTNSQNYPSIAQLEHNNPWRQVCGSSILSNNIILSAAHCINVNAGVQNHRTRAGATYRSRGGTVALINAIIIHPNYWNNIADADICVIRLAFPLPFSNTIRSIPILPQNYVIPNNTPGVAAGWGRTGSNQPASDVLLRVPVNILSHQECERRYGGRIHQDVVCAGYGGRATCFGDSGGPLYYRGILAGVTAWGPQICAHPTLPGGFIRTAFYTNWILANA